MTPEEQLQFDNLKREVETLKNLFYQNNYSDLQVFTKKVQFNSDVKLNGKFGAYGKTPIVIPTTSITEATFTANSGTAVNDNSTFGGYTLQQITKALQNLGLIT